MITIETERLKQEINFLNRDLAVLEEQGKVLDLARIHVNNAEESFIRSIVTLKKDDDEMEKIFSTILDQLLAPLPK